jgi:hypothetical protein
VGKNTHKEAHRVKLLRRQGALYTTCVHFWGFQLPFVAVVIIVVAGGGPLMSGAERHFSVLGCTIRSGCCLRTGIAITTGVLFYPYQTDQLRVVTTQTRPRLQVLGQGGSVTTRVEVQEPLAVTRVGPKTPIMVHEQDPDLRFRLNRYRTHRSRV